MSFCVYCEYTALFAFGGHITFSSKGRTAAFEAVNRGSIPWNVTKQVIVNKSCNQQPSCRVTTVG